MNITASVILVFVIIMLTFVVGYNFVIENRKADYIENHHNLCSQITDELNKNKEDHNCTAYYCYFENYRPPEGLEDTSTICICDCRMPDNSVVSIQILTQPSN